MNAWIPRTGDGSAAGAEGALLRRASAPPFERNRLALSRSGWRVYPSINCRLLGKAASMASDILRRYALKGVALYALTLLATACAGDGEPETAPTDPAASATTSVSSEPVTEPSPTSDPEAWRHQYTPSQLEAYEAALRRWESYEARAEPIWAKGKATPAAEDLFKEFFPDPAWRGYFDRLETYEEVGVKSEGIASVYWSRAKSVSNQLTSVQIVQCVDYTTIEGTQRGKRVPRPAWLETPQLRTLQLSKPDGYDWLIYGVVDATTGKSAPCEV